MAETRSSEIHLNRERWTQLFNVMAFMSFMHFIYNHDMTIEYFKS